VKKAETWVQHYWTLPTPPTEDGMLPKPPRTEWDMPLVVFPPHRQTRQSADGRLWVKR